jgi:hypothetical protein
MSAEQTEWERMRTSTLLLNTAHKSSCLQCKKGVCSWGISSMSVACHWMKKHMVGQNHIYIYIYIYIRFTYGIFGLEITKYTVYLYVYIRFWPTLKKRRVVMAVEQIHIVGQNRIYAPYMTVYLIESLPKTPYIHRIHMVLSNPTIRTCQVLRLFRKHAPYEMCHSFKYRDISFFLFPLRLRWWTWLQQNCSVRTGQRV